MISKNVILRFHDSVKYTFDDLECDIKILDKKYNTNVYSFYLSPFDTFEDILEIETFDDPKNYMNRIVLHDLDFDELYNYMVAETIL